MPTILFPGCIRSFNLLICAMIIFQERLFFATQMTRTSLPNFNFFGHQVSPTVPSPKLSLTNERCAHLCESELTNRNALRLYQGLEGVSSKICFLDEQKISKKQRKSSNSLGFFPIFYALFQEDNERILKSLPDRRKINYKKKGR